MYHMQQSQAVSAVMLYSLTVVCRHSPQGNLFLNGVHVVYFNLEDGECFNPPGGVNFHGSVRIQCSTYNGKKLLQLAAGTAHHQP
jgi:hypothetical protein